MEKVGYFCSYVPPEIIHAFGKIPVRVLPSTTRATEAEAFLPRNFCSLVKVTLASFLGGGSDLEAVIHSDSCDALRRLSDIWRHYVDVEALHLLDLPRNDSSLSCDYFQHSLLRLVEALEDRYGTELTAEDLGNSIGCYNEQRSLVGELDLRWRDGRVSTTRYYDLRHDSLTQDPALVNARLRKEMDDGLSQEHLAVSGPRVMLVGSLLTHSELVETVERYGSRVVAEDSCSIGREQAAEIEAAEDLDAMLGNLATAYLLKPPCPRMRDFSGRMAYLSQLVAQHEVDGVVASLYKFCDLFMSEYPVLRETMQKLGVPTLLLEDEGEATLSGQHRTRLEAFLEVLQ
jgi:benzoyl-CoA reductase subunit C